MADEKNNFTLTIDKLAGLGDGVGTHEGRRVFVPYTQAGDVVKARMVRRTTDADHAVLEEVVTPSVNRIAPVCKHYAQCGGCSLQHIKNEDYVSFKRGMALAAVRKAGYDPALVQELVTFPAASRRRVDLKVNDGKLGYFAANSHTLVEISECKVLEPELEKLVLQLKPLVATWRGDSIQINGLDNGYDIVLTGEVAPAWDFKALPSLKRAAFHNTKTTILHDAGDNGVTLGGVTVTPSPGAFLQAVRGAQDAITAIVLKTTKQSHHVLDLFCGLGTYSFPLSGQAKVTAVEGDASMVKALTEAAQKNGRKEKLVAKQRDLFREPLKPEELRRFDAVVINPPRNGALEQSKALAQSKIPVLVMVSCNPATFARDARVLMEGGYKLHKVTPIDQFTYSSHLEIIAEFTK